MSFSHWIYAFWLTQLALEPVLVAVLLARKVWRKFPLFVVFCVWSMVGDIATYWAYATSHQLNNYIHFYIANEAVSVTLVLALTFEVFKHLFSAHKALGRLATIGMQVVFCFLVVLGAIVFFTHVPLGQKGIVTAVMVVEETYRILEVGLIMALFLFSTAFGLHWRRQVFGIVLGLGISAAVKLTVVAVNPHSYGAAAILNTTLMLSYDVGLIIWFAYFLAPERVTDSAGLPKPAQLEQWNRAVMELIHQ